MTVQHIFTRLSVTAVIILTSIIAAAAGDKPTVNIRVSPVTGAIERITVGADTMNWILGPDGRQYPWITKVHGWGLGHLTVNGKRYEWHKPAGMTTDGSRTAISYEAGGIDITVSRHTDPATGDICELYTFANNGSSPTAVTDAGINTPFNDNYPGARECLSSRCHAHVWPAGEAAYVYAVRMNGGNSNLGLTVTDGEISCYEIMERGLGRANSQFRGVIALGIPDTVLAPGTACSVGWHLFAHNGKDDFAAAITARGGIYAEADRYVYEQGDTAVVRLKGRGGVALKRIVCDRPGDRRFAVEHEGRRTFVELLTVAGIDDMIDRRADFILSRQRMTDTSDPRYGAFMVYDNEGDSIYPNDTPNCSPPDRDEGAERVGMGIFLAEHYRRNPSPELLSALNDYAVFLRDRLQTEDYTTYSSVEHTGRNRGYNYIWVADYYFRMYELTGDKRYVTDGYRTLKSWFRRFGHGFYAIGIPVERSLECLKAADMDEERASLLADYGKSADVFISNSIDYPAHEVNYEQSIVAPAIEFLEQMYIVTGKKEYLDEVEKQLPVLEAFNGFQPSHHLNDIAIRHWDGFWFGKKEMFGDTFPHYWSAITAAVFHHYARITGNERYAERARNIALNNLSLFDEEGRGYCAYLYPDRVNGIAGKFNDPYSNDQDWALVYYYLTYGQ